MTTATYRTTPQPMPAVVTTEAEFVGYLKVNGPPTFMAPIQAFKPMNPYPMRLPVSWRGDRERQFVIGRKYVVVVRTGAWETTEAESAVITNAREVA